MNPKTVIKGKIHYVGHAGTVVCQKQNAGKNKRRDAFKLFPVYNASAQPGTFRRAQTRAGRYPLASGQTGQQKLGGNLLSPQSEQN